MKVKDIRQDLSPGGPADKCEFDPSSFSLAQLCNFVVTMSQPFDEVAEQIEDKAYSECEEGNINYVLEQLSHLALFFEQMVLKNDEVCRDLADVYVLTGDIYVFAGRSEESIPWFEKAIVADSSYSVPYHSLANAFLRGGHSDRAIKCWEEEIFAAPGNYYTYLQLADMYEKNGREEDFERVLQELLERDPGNIRALHRLTSHYEKANPEIDVEFLRRRIINADHALVKMELVIWTYHMCMGNRIMEAVHFLDNRDKAAEGLSITRLLKAHLYGRLKLYSRKRNELAEFRRLCHGNESMIRFKVDEFASVFGEKEADRLRNRLFSAGPAET